MKRLSRILTGAVATTLVALTVALAIGSSTVRAIPYNGDDTVGTNYPAFNVFTGTQYSGDEPDFFRGKVDGTADAPVDPLNASCTPGQKLKLRVYVHNAATVDLNQNGNGPGVAHNTKVKVNVPAAAQKNHVLDSTISASNAASVNDTLHINCGNEISLKYVTGSAYQLKNDNTTQALSDSIVSSGAPIGTNQPDGNMWGCWEQRVWVFLIVEVKEKSAPPVPIYSCDMLTAVVVKDRKYKFITSATAKDGATIEGYTYNFGDGSSPFDAATNVVEYTYSKDGTYNASVKVKIKVDGQIKVVEGSNCKTTVKIKTEVPPTPPQPPVVITGETPKELVDTGLGSVLGIFAGTSVIAAVAHRLYNLRRSGFIRW